MESFKAFFSPSFRLVPGGTDLRIHRKLHSHRPLQLRHRGRLRPATIRLSPAATYLAVDLDLAVDLSPQRNNIDPQRIRSPPSQSEPCQTQTQDKFKRTGEIRTIVSTTICNASSALSDGPSSITSSWICSSSSYPISRSRGLSSSA